MKKLFEIFKFIKERFSHDYYFDPDEDSVKLTKRIGVRVSPDEKELIDRFCELKGVSISRFLRIAASNEITRFITENKADEKYYNSKAS